MKIKRIMIVADDSPSARKAAAYGFALAKDLSGEVLLVTVIEPSLTAGNPDAGVFPDDALVAAQKQANALLATLKNHYAGGIKTELSYPVGETQDTVIAAAKKWKADLIVTGTHDASGLSGLFSENTEDSIIRHSPVPVFVVPALE